MSAIFFCCSVYSGLLFANSSKDFSSIFIKASKFSSSALRLSITLAAFSLVSNASSFRFLSASICCLHLQDHFLDDTT